MRAFLTIGALALILFSTATTADPAGARMFVRHDVADYGAWRKAYNAFNATQQEKGVIAEAVYQSTENPNDLTVIHDFKSAEDAKTFAASNELKTAMQGAGVKGAPTIWITKMAPGASGKEDHVRMFVRHEVADYATWRKGYDAFQPTARKNGATSQAVYQSTDNPNDVIAIHDFASADKAKAFAASPDLKSAMQGSGVKGQPQIWFTTRAR